MNELNRQINQIKRLLQITSNQIENITEHHLFAGFLSNMMRHNLYFDLGPVKKLSKLVLHIHLN